MFPGIDKVLELGRELVEQLRALRADVRELTTELRRSREKV